MDKLDLWHLCDELSVPEASLLLLGLDPAVLKDNPERLASPPQGYQAISTAIKNSIQSKKLSAVISYYEDNNAPVDLILWQDTKVSVSDLKKWLLEKNFTNNFFLKNDTSSVQSYLDPENEFYAPKLSAAVNAWLEVTNNPAYLNGKTPKQALDKWLRQNANDYGLTKDDGNPNESAIEEISKIANWKLEGGVAKTTPQAQTKRTKGSSNPAPEIPF